MDGDVIRRNHLYNFLYFRCPVFVLLNGLFGTLFELFQRKEFIINLLEFSIQKLVFFITCKEEKPIKLPIHFSYFILYDDGIGTCFCNRTIYQGGL